jgi:hypothetical protein
LNATVATLKDPGSSSFAHDSCLLFLSYPPGFDDGVLWDRYIWEGEVMDIEPYKDFNRKFSKSVFVPGVGCTVNSILDMNNINSTHGSKYDQEGLHRSKDPGVGAFAPYHGAETTVAIEEIAAGAELFATYGDYWYVCFSCLACNRPSYHIILHLDCCNDIRNAGSRTFPEPKSPSSPISTPRKSFYTRHTFLLFVTMMIKWMKN